MKLQVNGNKVELDVHTLDQVVEHYNLKEEHVVAEVNGEIMDRTKWKDYQLQPGAKIELVHFVGGG